MSNVAIFFASLSTLLGIIGATLGILTFRRGGKWRESDDGKEVAAKQKKVADDIHTIKNELMAIQGELGIVKKLKDEASTLDRRTTVIETTLKNVASVGDIRELNAELDGVRQLVEGTAGGVQRIETFLRERAG